VAQVFPGRKLSGTWLTNPAELPVALRGDADDLPALDLPAGSPDRKQLEDAIKAHSEALDERRLAEERRLFYVALTRAEHVLLASGHRWGAAGERPKQPSEFLVEIAAVHGAERWAEEPGPDDVNPATLDQPTALWPADPLGARSEHVHTGAALVRTALRELSERRAAQAEAAAELGGQLELLASEPSANVFEKRGAGRPGRPGPAGSLASAAHLRASQTHSEEPEFADPESEDPEGWAADVDVLLAERAAARARPAVELPAQLSVSQLVELAADPAALATRLRRPLPLPPNPHARRGTAFHAWLEQRFGAAQLLDLDELPGAADDGAASDDALEELQEAFLASEWADRRPAEVEVPFETIVAGVGVRGRMDAVFADPDGGWTVVDWKTGTLPEDERIPALAVQLAAYRLAWAALAGCEPERVRAAFHYVRQDVTLRPADLLDADGLRALLASVPLAG
jgi:DNA helicase II / ATP-dependent DNA helicase PcrA